MSRSRFLQAFQSLASKPDAGPYPAAAEPPSKGAQLSSSRGLLPPARSSCSASAPGVGGKARAKTSDGAKLSSGHSKGAVQPAKVQGAVESSTAGAIKCASSSASVASGGLVAAAREARPLAKKTLDVVSLLPAELLFLIFELLQMKDLVTCTAVSKSWRRTISHPMFWKSVDLQGRKMNRTALEAILRRTGGFLERLRIAHAPILGTTIWKPIALATAKHHLRSFRIAGLSPGVFGSEAHKISAAIGGPCLEDLAVEDFADPLLNLVLRGIILASPNLKLLRLSNCNAHRTLLPESDARERREKMELVQKHALGGALEGDAASTAGPATATGLQNPDGSTAGHGLPASDAAILSPIKGEEAELPLRKLQHLSLGQTNLDDDFFVDLFCFGAPLQKLSIFSPAHRFENANLALFEKTLRHLSIMWGRLSPVVADWIAAGGLALESLALYNLNPLFRFPGHIDTTRLRAFSLENGDFLEAPTFVGLFAPPLPSMPAPLVQLSIPRINISDEMVARACAACARTLEVVNFSKSDTVGPLTLAALAGTPSPDVCAALGDAFCPIPAARLQRLSLNDCARVTGHAILPLILPKSGPSTPEYLQETSSAVPRVQGTPPCPVLRVISIDRCPRVTPKAIYIIRQIWKSRFPPNSCTISCSLD